MTPDPPPFDRGSPAPAPPQLVHVVIVDGSQVSVWANAEHAVAYAEAPEHRGHAQVIDDVEVQHEARP